MPENNHMSQELSWTLFAINTIHTRDRARYRPYEGRRNRHHLTFDGTYESMDSTSQGSNIYRAFPVGTDPASWDITLQQISAYPSAQSDRGNTNSINQEMAEVDQDDDSSSGPSTPHSAQSLADLSIFSGYTRTRTVLTGIYDASSVQENLAKIYR